MFELRVGSARESAALAQGWATHVVSVADPGPAAVPRLAPRFVLVRFEDTERVMPDGPTREHVEQVLDFTRDLGSDHRLLVHCVAGLSRSTALATAILVQHGKTAEAAVAQVAAMRPAMWPNGLICHHADLVLGTGGTIVEALRQRQPPDTGIRGARGKAFAGPAGLEHDPEKLQTFRARSCCKQRVRGG